jgi:hypothetical protein
MAATATSFRFCPKCKKIYEDVKYIPFECVDCGQDFESAGIDVQFDYTKLTGGASLDKLPSFVQQKILEDLMVEGGSLLQLKLMEDFPEITKEEIVGLLEQAPRYFARNSTAQELLALTRDLITHMREIVFKPMTKELRAEIIRNCAQIGKLAKPLQDFNEVFPEIYSDIPEPPKGLTNEQKT